MISAHARDSFERILSKAVRTRLTRESAMPCEITPLGVPSSSLDARHGRRGANDPTSLAAQEEVGIDMVKRHQHVAVLTISAMSFRLLLLLHFDEDEATAAYFDAGADDKPFRETFLELSNLCCGAMNQELLRYFPDLGMSTPYVLSARCVPHLVQLNPNHLASWQITLDDAASVDATLCICAHAPLDFVADVSEAEDASGELELF